MWLTHHADQLIRHGGNRHFPLLNEREWTFPFDATAIRTNFSIEQNRVQITGTDGVLCWSNTLMSSEDAAGHRCDNLRIFAVESGVGEQSTVFGQ